MAKQQQRAMSGGSGVGQRQDEDQPLAAVDEDLAAALGYAVESEPPTLQTATRVISQSVSLADRVPCGRPGCRGHLTCYSSHTAGGSRVQFFSCFQCNWKPELNKLVTTLR